VHMHYRLVLKEAGVSLDYLKNSSELVHAGRDLIVLQAIRDAFEIHLLHRDVSFANVVLFREKKGDRRLGLLTDWDFSCTTNENGVASDAHRTGTFPFMSLNVISCSPGFRHTVQDDMESLAYVLLFCSMTLLEH
ncbi:hypothetical protein CONPUDRAFT_40888, partial [Coniophora puteana RWD-64-598 SS2]